jgi:hypothetical protein
MCDTFPGSVERLHHTTNTTGKQKKVKLLAIQFAFVALKYIFSAFSSGLKAED